MQFFRRFGLGIATSLFILLLVVCAVSFAGYAVLDKPATIKKALGQSGAYQILVDNTLTQKQEQLSAYLPVSNPEVREAVRQAFPASYLQGTTERNIDAAYAWIHGQARQPDFSADLDQPKEALAQNIGQVVEQKLGNLPACTNQIETPTTVAEVLTMRCRPPSVPTSYFVASAEQGIARSNVFGQVVEPVLTLKDDQGRSLTDSLDVLPKAHKYFIMSLYIVPAVLLLLAVAIFFSSTSRRQGSVIIARCLLVVGIITILLSLALVWALGKGAQWSSGSNSDLVLIEGKIVEVAHLIGAQLRNWLVGIGAGYILVGSAVLVIVKVRHTTAARQNMELNTSLGYNNNIPQAGTRFDPEAQKKEKPTEKNNPH